MNVCYEICGITDRGDSAENSMGMIYGCQLGIGRSNYEYYLEIYRHTSAVCRRNSKRRCCD